MKATPVMPREMQAEMAEMRKALEFYANERNWFRKDPKRAKTPPAALIDVGARAREVLGW